MSESVQPDVGPRTLRAVTEYVTVIEEARSLFEVTTESGSAYTVDLREPACTCPDFQYREGISECKHIRRVRLEVGQVDTERLESQLTERVEELEAEASQLEEQAQELVETAAKLRRALDRLPEVSNGG